MASFTPLLFHKRITTHSQHGGANLGGSMGTPVICDDVTDGPALPHIAHQRLVSIRQLRKVGPTDRAAGLGSERDRGNVGLLWLDQPADCRGVTRQ